MLSSTHTSLAWGDQSQSPPVNRELRTAVVSQLEVTDVVYKLVSKCACTWGEPE